MQACKAEGRPPFQVDGEFLARHQPGLLVTQDACLTCDPSTSAVMQVAPSHPTRAPLACPSYLRYGQSHWPP